MAAVNGVATFTSDFLSEGGEYTLAATDDALEEGVSSIFDVTAPVAILGDFNGANGANPEGRLLADSKGNLYGTTYSGGANNDGTVFEIVQGSGVVTTLATFSGDNGANPVSGLAMDHAGNFYGTTEKGGVNGSGTVFEVAKGSATIKTLATFNGTNGYAPWGGIVMDSSGNLFGTTGWGGNFNDGEIFELAKGKGEIKVLSSFDGENGVNPLGDLLLDKSGNLYGTTFGQANQTIGSVFKLTKGSRTVTVLGTFDDTGPAPMGGLAMDKKGNIFGVTNVDTRSGNSFIFEVTKGGEFLTLASVAGTIVARPEGGLMIDAEGNLYGASTHGGTNDVGGIFELPVGSSTIRMLTSFEGNIEGAFPIGTPISNGHGAIFGTTYGGGSGQNGTVFSFNLPTTVPQATKLATKPETIGQGGGASQGQIQVAVTDAHGKALANGTYSLTLSLVSAPKGTDWTFSPVRATTVNGVATFDIDDLPAVAGKYVFSASNWGLGTATVTIQEKKAVAGKTLRTHA